MLPVFDFIANVAAIATAIVAVSAWLWFRKERRDRQLRLETYLRNLKDAGKDQGLRSILHLMATLGMTEAELLDAAFRSKHLRSYPSEDDRGRADGIFFEYVGETEKQRLAELARQKAPGRGPWSAI